jgi:hypothetical protein
MKVTVLQCSCCQRYDDDLVNGLCVNCEDFIGFIDEQREDYEEYLYEQVDYDIDTFAHDWEDNDDDFQDDFRDDFSEYDSFYYGFLTSD